MKEPMKDVMKADTGLFRRNTVLWLAVFAGVLLIVAANGHLVYVAATSQPACVPHLRQSDSQADRFRAAVSSCAVK
jgi:hypothetical protein